MKHLQEKNATNFALYIVLNVSSELIFNKQIVKNCFSSLCNSFYILQYGFELCIFFSPV